MNSGWTLADINLSFRQMTGMLGTDQMSDQDVNAYLNNYYVFVMPFELKEQVTLQFLDFKTYPNIDVYSFPINFLTDQPVAYADGYPMIFYQDPDIFYQDYPQQYAVDNVGTGDGVTALFTGGLQNPPSIAGSLFITDGVQIAQDNGLGQFIGDVASPPSGSIDYITGAYTVTFAVAPASSATIYAKYIGYEATRPQGVLFFNNEFTLRPVPDQVYAIRMEGYIKPTQLINLTDMPILEEWGRLIAVGGALDFFTDRADFDNFNKFSVIAKRYENVALARTIQQAQSERGLPRF